MSAMDWCGSVQMERSAQTETAWSRTRHAPHAVQQENPPGIRHRLEPPLMQAYQPGKPRQEGVERIPHYHL
jgi:hypothetical protein